MLYPNGVKIHGGKEKVNLDETRDSALLLTEKHEKQNLSERLRCSPGAPARWPRAARYFGWSLPVSMRIVTMPSAYGLFW